MPPLFRLHRRQFPPPKPRFLIEDWEPVYLRTWEEGRVLEKVEAALAELAHCHVCPRHCGVDRLEDEHRVCRIGRHAIVSSAFPHHGEEDCLRGWHGSGTIFFAQCNLRCVFCQNWDISQQRSGETLDAGRIAAVALALQQRGCHNINFVTPEHVVPQVIEALAEAIPRGLRVPIVYNTSAYDSVASLKLLDGLVDIYMPDFKFWSPQSAKMLSRAKDYPKAARAAIREMHRQVGVLKMGRDGVARRGVLVRHLVMPGQADEAAAIFRWLAEELSPDTYLNIMGQYRPEHEVGRAGRKGVLRHAEINRRPTADEMHAAYTAARDAGLWRFDQRVGA
ncbi:MAG: radical SAM protein [Deltaproteobacteria bacterium]|nr:radical SAM protein [Deltaproteobacteria bacterium]